MKNKSRGSTQRRNRSVRREAEDTGGSYLAAHNRSAKSLREPPATVRPHLGSMVNKALFEIDWSIGHLWERDTGEDRCRSLLAKVSTQHLRGLYWLTQARVADVAPRLCGGWEELRRERLIEYLVDHGMPGLDMLIRADADGVDLDTGLYGFHPEPAALQTTARALRASWYSPGEEGTYLKYVAPRFHEAACLLWVICSALVERQGHELYPAEFFGGLRAAGRLYFDGFVARRCGVFARARLDGMDLWPQSTADHERLQDVLVADLALPQLHVPTGTDRAN